MSDPINIPSALVLGCNTPHGIGVLSDWIEEQTGFPLIVDQSGWSDNKYGQDGCGNGCGYGDDYGNGCGFGNIWIYGYGQYDGNGKGCAGYNSGRSTTSSGNGVGYGYGYGHDYGSCTNGRGCGF